MAVAIDCGEPPVTADPDLVSVADSWGLIDQNDGIRGDSFSTTDGTEPIGRGCFYSDRCSH
jgi:hypothetical protein